MEILGRLRTEGTGSALMWGGILMVLALGLGALLLIIRRLYFRWLKGEESERFSIETLEQMRESGQIDGAEFSRLRRVSLGLSPPETGKAKCESRVDNKLDDGENADTRYG